MDTIVSILRAAHCRSTHHFLAIDALEEISTERGRSLCQMLLAQFEQYLLGAKAPDTSFKDFENHVVHVQDGYWGGAAKSADKWYQKCLALLRQQQWKDAAFAIGVLSHYFTDPWMPLHTGQTPKETAVHRPLEWSVTCSYNEIAKLAKGPGDWTFYELPSTERWLSDAIHEGATLANEYYHTLIDSYDMRESSKQPSLALPIESKRILAQLFLWIWSGWAALLDKLAAEVSTPIAPHSLALPTLLASVSAPKKKIISMIENHEQKREVERIMDEYLQTGKVVRNVPEESVRVQATRATCPELKPPAATVGRIREQIQAHKSSMNVVPIQKVVSAPIQPKKEQVEKSTALPKSQLANVKISSSRSLTVKRLPVNKQKDAPVVRQEKPLSHGQSSERSAIPPKVDITSHNASRRLEHSAPIVDAPGIGPKTAKRLEAIGVRTVADFLEADIGEMVTALNTSWINDKILRLWKTQTVLATEVDNLNAAGAGLLALLGIESAEDLGRQSPPILHREIADAAESNEGKRILRNQEAPSLDVVTKWIDVARRDLNQVA